MGSSTSCLVRAASRAKFGDRSAASRATSRAAWVQHLRPMSAQVAPSATPAVRYPPVAAAVRSNPRDKLGLCRGALRARRAPFFTEPTMEKRRASLLLGLFFLGALPAAGAACGSDTTGVERRRHERRIGWTRWFRGIDGRGRRRVRWRKYRHRRHDGGHGRIDGRRCRHGRRKRRHGRRERRHGRRTGGTGGARAAPAAPRERRAPAKTAARAARLAPAAAHRAGDP